MIKNKKGIELSQAFGAILTLVLVAVLVIVGILLFVSLISGPFANVTASTTTSESITPSMAGTAVNNATLCSFDNFAIITATNSTSGEVISSGNYTTTGAGLIINSTNMELGSVTSPPWIVNYSYTWGSEACTASQAMVTQFATYPALVGLVGTIIFLGIIIGVLIASFVFGGRRAV